MRAATVMLPKFSIIRICGSTPWLKTVPSQTPRPPCHAPNPFPSDFRRLSSFGAGRSTHTGVEVSHYPISTLFCSPLNSSSAPESTSLIDFLLQDCRNTCTRL